MCDLMEAVVMKVRAEVVWTSRMVGVEGFKRVEISKGDMVFGIRDRAIYIYIYWIPSSKDKTWSSTAGHNNSNIINNSTIDLGRRFSTPYHTSLAASVSSTPPSLPPYQNHSECFISVADHGVAYSRT